MHKTSHPCIKFKNGEIPKILTTLKILFLGLWQTGKQPEVHFDQFSDKN